MSVYVDTKYLQLLSESLDKFKRKGDDLYNFRCPFCGDSEKSKSKSRGYVYKKEDALLFKCHNCNLNSNMYGLLRNLNPELLLRYKMETKYEYELFNSEIKEFRTNKKAVYKVDNPFKDINNVLSLSNDHPARVYLDGRKIPSGHQMRLYYAENYFKWVNTLIPEKFTQKALFYDCPRIVIPFYNRNRDCFGFQGRAITDTINRLRYVSVILDENERKLFGLEGIDYSRQVRVVEGPFDSFFVNNAIALTGTDGKIDDLFDDFVVIYDNQPNNIDVVKKVERDISKGYKVVVWPSYIKEKDINEMIINGRSIEDIENLITSRTYERLEALTRLNEWKKV